MRNRVLAHRGFWNVPDEKNSIGALIKAIELGFGLEYDIRDQEGQIVLSHDLPVGKQETLQNFLGRASEVKGEFALQAINIKSDGLSEKLSLDFSSQLEKYPHFFFDMSFVESVKFRSKNLNFAPRMSEFEVLNANDDGALYIWVDAIVSDWWVNGDYDLFSLFANKIPVFVSPELHGRPHEIAWKWLNRAATLGFDFHICTDFPLDAENEIYG